MATEDITETIELKQDDIDALSKWNTLQKLKKNKLTRRDYKLDMLQQCIVATTAKIKRPRTCNPLDCLTHLHYALRDV